MLRNCSPRVAAGRCRALGGRDTIGLGGNHGCEQDLRVESHPRAVRPLSDLERLTETQKLELVQQLHAELQDTHTELAQATAEVTPVAARVAELEQAASVPPKTPGNSSVPPSSSPEPSVPKGRRRRKRQGRPGARLALASGPRQSSQQVADRLPGERGRPARGRAEAARGLRAHQTCTTRRRSGCNGYSGRSGRYSG